MHEDSNNIRRDKDKEPKEKRNDFLWLLLLFDGGRQRRRTIPLKTGQFGYNRSSTPYSRSRFTDEAVEEEEERRRQARFRQEAIAYVVLSVAITVVFAILLH